MKSKKSQISLILIICFVVFIGASFVIYLQKPSPESLNSGLEQVTDFSLDSSAVRSSLEICLKSVGEQAIGIVASQGGYFKIPKNIATDSSLKTSYHFYKNKSTNPSKAIIEKEISDYIAQNLHFCLESLREFEDYKIYFNQSGISIKTSVQKEYVILDAITGIEIKNSENTASVPKIEEIINGPEFYDLYESGREIINEQSRDPYNFCLSCIIESATKRNETFSIVQTGDMDVTVLLSRNSTSQNKRLVYAFSIKYQNTSCDNLPKDIPEKSFERLVAKCADEKISATDYKPRLDLDPRLQAFSGKEFSYQVRGKGFNPVFSDFTEIFEISKNGMIKFTPEKNQTGNYTVWIKIEDSLKNKDYGSFEMEIKNE
ncbi:MAG TPA: hypothetical protein VI564_01990 [Candidatus Nanoarchaeia archaeon]|nr:hypothetical protein [Candidatus Nanoarchaeia archaeon]